MDFNALTWGIQNQLQLTDVQTVCNIDPSRLRAKGNNGWLPLHHAAVLSNPSRPDLVEYLARAWSPALQVATENGGMLPIHLAVRKSNSTVIVQFLANEGPPAVLQTGDHQGWTPLHHAVRYATDDSMVGILLDKDPRSANVKNKHGWLPIHIAAQFSPISVVERLVNARGGTATLTVRLDEGGRMPLHVAAQFSTPEVVSMLAKAGPNALHAADRDSGGWHPIHYAARFNSREVVQCLAYKDPKTLQATTKDGRLPIHVAAGAAEPDGDRDEVAEFLAMKHPKGLQTPDDRGWLPLHHAAQQSSSNADIARRLVDKFNGALHVKTKEGWIPMHFAAGNNSFEMAKLILERSGGAVALQAKDNEGMIPLHHASMGKDVSVVEHLVDAWEPGLQVRNEDGSTPLHLAAESAPLDVVQFLVEKRPQTLIAKNNKGQRPVEVAQQHDKLDVAHWLECEMDDRGLSLDVDDDDDDDDDEKAGAAAQDPREEEHVVAPAARDPHEADRDRVRKVVQRSNVEPAVVSCAYVEFIRTDTILGEGFFGTVYKGRDAILACDFAIKSINTEILRGGTRQDLEAAMRTFQTEQEALSRFRHPNIAALFAYTNPTADQGSETASFRGYHLVYELAEKGSLDGFLKSDDGRRQLGSFSQRVQVAVDVLTAIQFLHKGSKDIQSCFHRDIKSANIVIKRDFTAQLIDCGLAKFVNDRVTTTGFKGTQGYICPQYVKTGKYSAACDLYSFGVVMLELWTGSLQNHESGETGATFNFGEEYIYEEREANGDADAAMGLDNPLPGYATRYTESALKCISERSKDRPSGDDVLKQLKSILEECVASSEESDGRRRAGVVRATSFRAVEGAEICSTCRTMPAVLRHALCALCLVRQAQREEFGSHFAEQAAATEELRQKLGNLHNTVDNKVVQPLDGLGLQVGAVNQKLDMVLPVLAQLDLRLNQPVPRMFIMVPASLAKGWKHPKSWLQTRFQHKYHLYFVCAATHRAISPPIQLKVAKDWVKKAAPVLAAGLYLLQASIKAGLNVSLDLDGTAANLFQLSSSHIAEMLHELGALIDKSSSSCGLLGRLQSHQLSDRDVQELQGEAYEMVISKAREQNGWRSCMVPVRVPPNPQVVWVTKEASASNEYKFEIVRE